MLVENLVECATGTGGGIVYQFSIRWGSRNDLTRSSSHVWMSRTMRKWENARSTASIRVAEPLGSPGGAAKLGALESDTDLVRKLPRRSSSVQSGFERAPAGSRH